MKEDETKIEALVNWIYDHSDYDDISHSAMERAIRAAIDYGRETSTRPEAEAIMRRTLETFAKCDLNESNCASLEVATRRIRGIAQRALDECIPQAHSQERNAAKDEHG